MADETKTIEKTPSTFDPMVIHHELEKCTKSSAELNMDNYLTAYRELNKFFQMLGSVFSFVANDIASKIEILEKYRSDADVGHNYETFQSMINYEQENNLLKDKKRPSGARTALRLHRALRFFADFMKELSTLDDDGCSGPVARDCYKNTLAKYHPWYIQKSASLAMYALPTRQQLIEKAFADQESDTIKNTKAATEKMNTLGGTSDTVYEAVEQLYKTHDLLDLP